MSFFMAFFMLLVNAGFTNDFFMQWLKTFGIGILISLPVSIVFIPLIAKSLSKIFKVY
ncbi:DUF2798 domain-containing protein [uncultured Aquimarina sp.]|uniref:DUF2798 domain-containing protein n=1 Tax=uncultured Aquimarina sp. TaxID=575652 RepID=UPI003455FF7C